MRRRALLPAVLVLCAACDSDAGPPRVAAAAPALVALDGARHDAGVVEEGDRVEHEFAFRNTTDRALVDLRVRSNCACTAGVLDRTDVAPGGVVRLSVLVTTVGKPGALLAEAQLVEAASPTHPLARAAVAVRVERTTTLALEPGDTVLAGREPAEVTLELVRAWPPGDAEPELVGLDLVEGEGALEVGAHELAAAADGARLESRTRVRLLLPPLPATEGRARTVVEGVVRRADGGTLRARAEVVREAATADLAPPSLFAGALPLGVEVTRPLRVRGPDSSTATLSVQAASPRARVVLGAAAEAPDGARVVPVSVTALAAGPIEAEILVETRAGARVVDVLGWGLED